MAERTLAWACSLFAGLGDVEQRLYGRNFDWDHSPAVLLFTAGTVWGTSAGVAGRVE